MIDFDSLSPVQLADALRRALARGLPGRIAQRAMTPELAYGRHHGPIPADARRAAVLLALNPGDAAWSLPAILRPATMKAHAGQVSLPGGMVEDRETPEETALREFEEELGGGADRLEVLGSLAPVFVFISNFEVTPIVAVSHRPLALRPNPDEVEEIVPLPLARLMDPACLASHLIRRGELAFRAPYYAIAGRQVWGATSLIVAEFVELLRHRT
jgi:8-oxo-dGTP pyrophosphatase MutT (NUDIX family)